jgi:hypothetical protein
MSLIGALVYSTCNDETTRSRCFVSISTIKQHDTVVRFGRSSIIRCICVQSPQADQNARRCSEIIFTYRLALDGGSICLVKYHAQNRHGRVKARSNPL